MKYFKNTELAKLYNVSEKSVRNWIEAAQTGKLDLQLNEAQGKFYVSNTAKNNQLIEELVQKGKKYKNTRGLKTLVPTPEFYATYNEQHIIDIVSNLTIHREIPLQYGYLDGGASSWDKYANRLVKEQGANVLTATSDLLDLNARYIDQLIGDRKVNVVDLGPGNGLPVRSTLDRLLKAGRLNRYIAIDFSRDMLAILEDNINKWFEGRVAFEGYVRNLSEERFNDILAKDYVDDDTSPINLVFLFGGTLSNLRLPDYALRVINSSLRPNDLFFCSGYLDTLYTRRYFDLSGANDQNDPQQSGLIPSFLNINESLSEFEYLFSEEKHARFRWMKPKVDLSIKFSLDEKIWNVELRRGDPILLWRHKHYTYPEFITLFDTNGFDTVQSTKSEDQNYILLMARIKNGIDS